MFGFLRGPSGDTDYRRVYARSCRYLRLHYGYAAAPLVSYEAVLAFQMMREALGEEPLDSSNPTCCRLRGASKLHGEADQQAGRVCNALGVLLASIKLEDDVRDDRSLAARTALRFFGNAIQRAKACFAEIDPQAPERFKAIIADHVEMERTSRGGTLEEFAAPTAEGFACAFSLLAKSDKRLSGVREELRGIGYELGQAIIAADCAMDWRRDLRRGLPNPVRDGVQAAMAVTAAQTSLSRAGWNWAQAVPDPCVSLRVLKASVHRLDSLRASGGAALLPDHNRLPSPRYARAGDCDCPVGDCGDDGCCDGVDSCVGCPGCDCLGSCESGCCGNRSEKKNRTSQKAIRGGGSFVGRRGVTRGELNPAGVVVINGRTHAARTAGEHLPAETEVVVVEDDELGVVVERTTL